MFLTNVSCSLHNTSSIMEDHRFKEMDMLFPQLKDLWHKDIKQDIKLGFRGKT